MLSLDVVSDVICPWCYVGKRRLEEALDGFDAVDTIGLAWRPFQLNPTMPTEGMDRQSYIAAKFGSPERARGIYDRVAEVGASVGLDFAFERIQRTPNTIQAHRLIRFAQLQRRQDPVVAALFKAYFMEGRDIGADGTLTEIACDVGFDGATVRDYLAGTLDLDKVLEEDAMARRMGVDGVPCFIIARTYAVSGAQEAETLRGALTEAARRTRIETPAGACH
jgi:predicted DsbA family dithiol-disulfide isomerase